jgi:hypothetical protein
VAQTLLFAAPRIVSALLLASHEEGRDESRPCRHECPRHFEDYLIATGAPITVPITSPEITSSTRRFCCRPDAVSFEATG